VKVLESPFLAKKTTSGRMLGCYILWSESLFEVNRLMVEVEVDRQHRQQVKG
jgi:hypothetical protein